MNSPQCVHDHNRFCFVCSQYLFSSVKARNIDTATKFIEAYQNQFGLNLADRNVHWSPEKCCNSCCSGLVNPQRQSLFSSPTIWNQPQNHPYDCFFCKFERGQGATSLKSNTSLVYPTDKCVVMAVKKDNPNEFSVAADPFEADILFEAQGGSSPSVIDQSVAMTLMAQIEKEKECADTMMSIDYPSPMISIDTSLAYQLRARHEQPSTSREEDLFGESTVLTEGGSVWEPIAKPSQHAKPSHVILNDLVRDLGLAKDDAEMFASR